MHAQTSTDLPICLRGGLGFASLLVLMGILLALFVLWSFSCLGAGVLCLGALA